jgi:predicted MFS family arabinose efflux permease
MKRALALPAYRRLLAAFALNELAWSVGTLALSVLVYRRTGSALGSAAFYLSSQFLPALVSPFVVARVDQHPPRQFLPVLYSIEAILFAGLAWMTARFSLAPVLALALCDGVVAMVARSLGRTATVDVLQPADLLREGNAITNAAFSVCFMAGPLIGGIIVAAGGTVAALLANCGLFAAIALILVTATGLPGAVHEREGSAGRLRAAVEHVRGHRVLRWLLLLQVAGVAVFTISVPVEVVLAQHTLHAGAGGYGALLSGWGTGAVVGSLAYARWRRRTARVLLALSGAALAVGFIAMAAAPSIEVAIVGAAVGGIGNGIMVVATQTALQEYTAQRWMALVMSLNQSITTAAPGIGILLGGLITALTDPRVAFVIAGAGSLVYAITVWVVLRPAAMPDSLLEPEFGPQERLATNGATPPSAVERRETSSDRVRAAGPAEV